MAYYIGRKQSVRSLIVKHWEINDYIKMFYVVGLNLGLTSRTKK